MKKIPSIYLRDYTNGKQSLLTETPNPECDWVFRGEGVATVKYDGTSCMVKDGVLYKRYDVKQGKTAPEGFIPAQEPDMVTGHWPGWVLVSERAPEDKWHREAWLTCLQEQYGDCLEDGTYELIGPKLQGNPYMLDRHEFRAHGAEVIPEPGVFVLRGIEGIRLFLSWKPIEGIVYHHPDGRMAKIKAKDLDIQWPRN